MRLIFLVLFFIFSFSCHYPTSQNNDNDIISLNVGNKYRYHNFSISGSNIGIGMDWYSTNKIVKDTIINYTRYSYFTNQEYLRASANYVYKLKDNRDQLIFDFSTETGDTVFYENYKLVVDQKANTAVFGSDEIKISLSNSNFATDTLVKVVYATKFGLLSIEKKYLNLTKSQKLIGALIESESFGDL